MTEIRSGIRRAFQLALGRRGAIEAELREELELHLALRARQLEAMGMSPEAARREATRHFRSLEETRRELHRTAIRREGRMRVARFVDAIRQDVVFVVRQLAGSPGLSLTIVVTLALGIGANALMFGVLDRILLRPPEGVSGPEHVGRLAIEVREDNRSWRQTSFSYPTFRDIRDNVTELRGVAAYSFPRAYTLGLGVDATELEGMLVSPSYFDVLGVRPALGRFMDAEDGAEPVGRQVVVISHRLWRTQFGGDPGIIGRRLPVGRRSFTVIGVAPPRFSGLGLSAIDAWFPLSAADGMRFAADSNWMTNRQTTWLGIVVRVDERLPDDSLRLTAVHRRLTDTYRNGSSSAGTVDTTSVAQVGTILRKVSARNSPDVKVARLLLAVSAFVLLIACANVANLLLARAVHRQQEIAIRMALGISRLRLTGLLVIETLVLCLLGGAASMIVVQAGGRIVGVRFLGQNAESAAAMVDPRVIAFAGAATALVALIIGLAPIAQALRAGVGDAFKVGVRSSQTPRQRKTTVGFLLTQVALCTVLLIGTGLFIRSLQHLNRLNLGIDTRRLLIAEMNLRSIGLPPDQIAATYLRLADRVRNVPGVSSATVALAAPFASSFGAELKVPGLDKLPRTADGGPYINAVDEHYFATLGSRIIAGRNFQPSDRHPSAFVAIVNQSMAQRFWPGQSPLGKCLKVGGDTVPCSIVVGMVENARRQSLIEGESFQYFVPLEAGPAGWKSNRVLFARTSAAPETMAATVQRAMQSENPGLPFADVRPLRDLLEYEYRPYLLGSTMFSLFGAVALVLVLVGLYGSLAYDVARRGRELSIRVALGAQARDILSLVLRRGGAIAAAGVIIGLAASFASGRWVSALLYEVSARDPVVFLAAAGAVLLASLAASIIPARRASAVDIREALTSE